MAKSSSIPSLQRKRSAPHSLLTQTRFQLKRDPIPNANLAWMNVFEVVSVEKLSDTTARAAFRFPVQHEYLNPAQGLHGGLSAGMFDTMTTWTLDPIRKPGFWSLFGTTRSLNLTYLRPAAEGEMLRMECEVSRANVDTSVSVSDVLQGRPRWQAVMLDQSCANARERSCHHLDLRTPEVQQ